MKIEFPVYHYTVIIVVTKNIELAYNKIFPNKKCKWKDETIGALCKDDESQSYIFLRPDSTSGVIAHECNHALQNLFRYIGAEDIDEEIYSYHLQYLIDKIKIKK